MGEEMKKVVVIGRRDAGEKNDALQLANALNSEEVQAEGVYYEDVILTSKQGGSDMYIAHGTKPLTLEGVDTLILINWSFHRLYADLAHSIAYIAAKKGVKIWNKELLYARSSTKVSQIVRLSYEPVLFPMTVFSLTPELVKEYISDLGVSFIAKDPLASRGRRNYLCDGWPDFLQKSSGEVDATYVFQQVIPNDGSDIRMFVAGKEPGLVIMRKGQGTSHLNNVSQGATAELIPIESVPNELLELTRKVAHHFERELCGIDFMQHSETGEYIFLEINTTPQIINGVFAEEKAEVMRQALIRS